MSKNFGRHIFISYSRQDSKRAESLRYELEMMGRVKFWVDYANIEPGTEDWQLAIRSAVSQAYVVIFLASPSSGVSKYVNAELLLAQSKNIHILPVWIKGESWVDCAPLHMAHSQYIDCRENTCVDSIISSIYSHVGGHFPKHQSPPFDANNPLMIPIHDKDNKPLVAFTSTHYQTVQPLLDDLYMNYLIHQTNLKPYTYGKDWVLVNTETDMIYRHPDFLPQNTSNDEDLWNTTDIKILLPFSPDPEAYKPWKVSGLEKVVPVALPANLISSLKLRFYALHELVEVRDDGVPITKEGQAEKILDPQNVEMKPNTLIIDITPTLKNLIVNLLYKPDKAVAKKALHMLSEIFRGKYLAIHYD